MEREIRSRTALAYRGVPCLLAGLGEVFLGERLYTPAARQCLVEPVFHPASTRWDILLAADLRMWPTSLGAWPPFARLRAGPSPRSHAVLPCPLQG